MWVTESGDAGAGGHTWASTYAEVIRTLNEIGSFAAVTDGVIFHKWVRENYPECTIVGPSDTDPGAMSVDADGNPHPWAQGGGMDTAGIAAALAYCSTKDLMDGCPEKPESFS